MQEFGIRDLYYQVFIHLRGMWRHRWHMILVAWFVCLGGWAVVYTMEDQYVSHARVQIEDPQGQLRPYLAQMSVAIDVTTEARRVLNGLLRRSNLLKVVEQTDLAREATSEEETERIIAELRAQLSVGTQGRNMYVISHRHTRPRVTQQVVQALLNLLMEGPLQRATSGHARQAQQFLDEQISIYESKLAEAEGRLQEFKRRNSAMLPTGGGGGFYVELKNLQTRLGDEEVRVRELEQRVRTLNEQLQEMATPQSPSGNPVASPLAPDLGHDRQIQELNAQLQELLGKHYMRGDQRLYLYNEEHPDIIALRRSIAMLEQDRRQTAEQFNQPREEPVERNPLDDPIYRQTKLNLAQVEVELASARARFEQFQSHYHELKSQETTLPAIEAELLRLERNVENIRGKMLSLMTSEGTARFSGDVAEGLSERVRFKIVDLPNLPYAPAGPNRPLFLTVVLMGGLLAGATMALFLSIMRPVFDSPAALKKELGLPVLGTVSMVREGAEGMWKHSLPMFLFVLLGLLALYGVVMVFQVT